ncbi:MAG: hypothetical protein ABIB61_00520 [Candidatus Shapirobacteria bacterium]
MKNDRQRGQATIIILTMMVAAAGVALFLTRGVQIDLQITKVQEESARAFSAAEAGIESALYDWQPGATTIPLQTGTVTTVSSNLGEGETSFVLPGIVRAGDFGVVWLAAHDEDGQIDETGYYNSPVQAVSVCFANDSAIELVLFYKLGGDYFTVREAYDANEARREENSFSAPTLENCAGLSWSGNISYPAGAIPLFMAAKVYYENTSLGAKGIGEGASFPSQGKLVTSAGQVDSLSNKIVSRRLKVLQSWDIPPLIFLDPLFAGSGGQAF